MEPGAIIDLVLKVKRQLGSMRGVSAAVDHASRRLDSLRVTLEDVRECLDARKKQGVLEDANNVVKSIAAFFAFTPRFEAACESCSIVAPEPRSGKRSWKRANPSTCSGSCSLYEYVLKFAVTLVGFNLPSSERLIPTSLSSTGRP